MNLMKLMNGWTNDERAGNTDERIKGKLLYWFEFVWWSGQQGTFVKDCLLHWCCPFCAYAQEARVGWSQSLSYINIVFLPTFRSQHVLSSKIACFVLLDAENWNAEHGNKLPQIPCIKHCSVLSFIATSVNFTTINVKFWKSGLPCPSLLSFAFVSKYLK